MKQYSGYEIKENGSYKSTCFLNPSEVYKDEYWSPKNNRSTIDEQVANVLEKNKSVKEDIYQGGTRRILEIACAPGVLIGDLSDSFECHGIEVDERYKDNIEKYSKKTKLHFGFFPEITSEWESGIFSNIIALDVLEHVEDGLGFLSECNRLLCNGGRLIIQAPIIMEDEVISDVMFIPSQHIWIYNHIHLKELLSKSGLTFIKNKRIFVGHEHWVADK